MVQFKNRYDVSVCGLRRDKGCAIRTAVLPIKKVICLFVCFCGSCSKEFRILSKKSLN